MTTLKGKLVTLRKMRLSDAKEFYKLMDYSIASVIPPVPWPFEPKHATQFVKAVLKDLKQKKVKRIGFTIIENKTNKVIGQTDLHNISSKNKYAETGTWFGKEYRGKGYNSETKKLLLNYGFKTLKLHKITMTIFGENKRSIKAVKKLGAIKEGILREHNYKLGKYHDLHIYSILKKEWQPSKIKIKH